MTHESAQIDLVSPSSPPVRASAPLHAKATTGRSTWQARREDGMARAQDHAEDDIPGWTEAAAEFLRDYALTVAGPFLVEQARAASRHRVPAPANGKAWGPAAVMAVKRGWIVKAGFGPASSSNGSPKTLFRAGTA